MIWKSFRFHSLTIQKNINFANDSITENIDMRLKKTIIFVVNPKSGTEGKEAIIKKIEEHIDRSIYDYQIVKTAYAGHAEEIARNAARFYTDIIVAVGGDGTVNEIARGIIHTNSALGIIPCGSGNGLARHLHIPTDPLSAIAILNRGYRLCIDYGKINNKPFFCTCGVGFDAFVSLKFADSGKRGPITYIQNTLKECLTYKPETYEIVNEEMSIKHKAFLIACANASQYGNNAYIAPQASLTDGLLDITILEPFTVLDVPSLAFRLFNKTIDQDSRIKTYQTKRVTIHRTKPSVIHIDGDPVMGEAELNVEIVPKGLNVITTPEDEKRETPNFLQQISELLTGLSPINIKK